MVSVRKLTMTDPVIYSNNKNYALLDPTGSGVYFGAQNSCYGEFFARRYKRIMLTDADLAKAKEMLQPSGWQVVRARMVIYAEEPVQPLKFGALSK